MASLRQEITYKRREHIGELRSTCTALPSLSDNRNVKLKPLFSPSNQPFFPTHREGIAGVEGVKTPAHPSEPLEGHVGVRIEAYTYFSYNIAVFWAAWIVLKFSGILRLK